jgi:hypothetical protein
MYSKIISSFFLVLMYYHQAYSQAVVVRPLFGGVENSKSGGSPIYFSVGRVAITRPNHQGLSFGFNDENPTNPRRIEGVLLPPNKDILTEYEVGIADIHTKSNFVIDVFQYSFARNESKTYRFDRISTGMGFQFNLGTNVWLRQVNYASIEWLGNILMDNIEVDGGDSGNLWLRDEVYNGSNQLRLLIRQTQLSYRPQISLGLKFSKSFLLSLNAGYIIPFYKSTPNIFLKNKGGSDDDSEEFPKYKLTSEQISLRDLNTNAPAQASSFQLNRWYVNARLAVHIFGE